MNAIQLHARATPGFDDRVTQTLAVLQKALTRERARYAAKPAEAAKFLAIGEAPRNPKLPAAEHAAWAQVATLLLNLSETVTRN